MTIVLSLFATFVLVLFVGWALFFKFPEEYSIKYRIVKYCDTERTRDEIADKFSYLTQETLDYYLHILTLEGKLQLRWDLDQHPAVKVYSPL